MHEKTVRKVRARKKSERGLSEEGEKNGSHAPQAQVMVFVSKAGDYPRNKTARK